MCFNCGWKACLAEMDTLILDARGLPPGRSAQTLEICARTEAIKKDVKKAKHIAPDQVSVLEGFEEQIQRWNTEE